METRKRIRPNGPHQSSSQHPPRLNILQLPSEVLEAIFAVLTACQVEALRLVCLRFRDIADKNLNLRFLKVLPRVERALKDAREEEKTVTLEKSRGQAVSDVSHLTRRRRLFGFVRSVVRLLRAICLRYICPKTASSAPFSVVRVFVGGQLLDALDRTLKIAWSRRLRRRNTDVVTLIRVTDLWVTHFHNHHEQKMVVPTLTPSLTASSGYIKSEGILFGSKVIDLLECLEGCQKITSGRFSDGGWFEFHGEYRLRRVFFACLRREDERPLTDYEQIGLGREGAGSLTFHEQIGLGRREGAGSLTDHEQIGLHECLRTLVSLHNENLFVGGLGDAWEDGGLRYGLVTCDKTLYYYGIFGEIGFRRIFGGRVEAEDSVQVTIRVTLKCRGDLCPIDCLKDLTPVQEHFPVPGDPDLRLKLEVECPEAGLRGNRLPTRYECLVENRLDRTAATTRARRSLCPPSVFIDRKRREVL
uniref:F-box domain-containing protein n=1 Tax=Timema bartmani TaxID=61472 RepID=A0A7R9EY15_9NEOP|nr:unnamed protein product [Timema bartmani]